MLKSDFDSSIFTFTNENNKEVGRLSIEGENTLGGVFIQPEFRGQGLYRQFLVIALGSLDFLWSENRNDNNNGIYEQWMNVELDYSDQVTIELTDGKLTFTIYED